LLKRERERNPCFKFKKNSTYEAREKVEEQEEEKKKRERREKEIVTLRRYKRVRQVVPSLVQVHPQGSFRRLHKERGSKTCARVRV